MTPTQRVRVSYGPVKKTFVEGHQTPVLSRQFFVDAGPSYEASRLLRAAGLRVQPSVTHPNGSGGMQGYVLLDHPRQKLPITWSL
jgi:hypothetical protein